MPPRVYSSVVERCPDKTEVHGSIPCTRTMGYESFAQPSQSSEELHELDMKSQKELEAVKEVIAIWGMLERKEEPPLPATKEDAERYIEKFEFLKEKNTKDYSLLEKRALHNRVDAYIEKLREVSGDTEQELKQAA
jgi:hypothetical protein